MKRSSFCVSYEDLAKIFKLSEVSEDCSIVAAEDGLDGVTFRVVSKSELPQVQLSINDDGSFSQLDRSLWFK